MAAPDVIGRLPDKIAETEAVQPPVPGTELTIT
jgi:hypothetical protein